MGYTNVDNISAKWSCLFEHECTNLSTVTDAHVGQAEEAAASVGGSGVPVQPDSPVLSADPLGSDDDSVLLANLAASDDDSGSS